MGQQYMQIQKEKTVTIGFTGTRKGLSVKQKEVLLNFLSRISFSEVHHGDCIGADEQFHYLIRRFFPYVRIVIHPPRNPKYRAFCKGDIILPEKDYLVRNKDIVNSSDIIIACPKENHEIQRSGTWMTIRYARKKRKKIIIVFPDGEVSLSH